jgi:hypothetical protein
VRAQSAQTTIPASPAPGLHCSDITVPATAVSGPFYAAFRWNPSLDPGFAIALDTSLSTPVEPAFSRAQTGGSPSAWTPLTSSVPNARALGIGVRGILTEDLLLPCHDDANVLCLDQGRFRVEVVWRRRNDEEGLGQAVGFRSDDAGLFYFFDPNNWEMLVKVLNACGPPFDHFWVFYAATTDVEFTLLVTDTQTGVLKTYFNPQRNAAAPVQDTSAFATCP